ncbi:ribosome silencing factor [Reichenbachiella versicolor]|uniref:ribosome silencing factor n=1 Tax=Reichenbachiella versicolor TaxID=1821036 RepID=UPI000D6E9A67|nr:ribosome silencing factor [Reichenbachiella versicolor]
MTDVQGVDSQKTSQLVVKGMQERKAQEIVVMDLRKIPKAVADYFVICSGTSDTQIDAIADAVEEEVYKVTETNPWRKEGKEHREWILIDYADVVVHIFKQDKREFYALEKLWGDAVITKIDEQ